MKQGTPEADAAMANSVPRSLQEEVLGFVQMRMLESRNESALTEDLLAFATQLFQPMYEELSLLFWFSCQLLRFLSTSFSGSFFMIFKKPMRVIFNFHVFLLMRFILFCDI